MKVWYGFGTEHSMNLVMIGRFQDAAAAETVRRIIEEFKFAVQADETAGRLTVGEPSRIYSDEILRLLMQTNIHNIGPDELEQFLYDVNVTREGDSIVITTDETSVEAFLKLMLSKGARVEVYSAHDYPDTPYGRGR
ncbi:MAG TPA: DUF6375 family protein [Actinomycetota bacterium]|nr:DUF6375 family protein [Actinomycetota bacterium]